MAKNNDCIVGWELAFTLLDKLADFQPSPQSRLGISIHPS